MSPGQLGIACAGADIDLFGTRSAARAGPRPVTQRLIDAYVNAVGCDFVRHDVECIRD